MTSREGELRTFQSPESRFNLRAAKSKRALCASQGLISWSNVTVGVNTAIRVSSFLPFLPHAAEPVRKDAAQGQDAAGSIPFELPLPPVRPGFQAWARFVPQFIYIGTNPSESRPADSAPSSYHEPDLVTFVAIVPDPHPYPNSGMSHRRTGKSTRLARPG